MRTSSLPEREAIPAGMRAQELLGGSPLIVPQPTQHWSLGSNYYLARGQPPPFAGALLDPTADQVLATGLPFECQPPNITPAERKQGCSPLGYCADAHCPPDTVPLWQGNQLMCAGPGAASQKPNA